MSFISLEIYCLYIQLQRNSTSKNNEASVCKTLTRVAIFLTKILHQNKRYGAIKTTRPAIPLRIDRHSLGLMGVLWSRYVLEAFWIKKREHRWGMGQMLSAGSLLQPDPHLLWASPHNMRYTFSPLLQACFLIHYRWHDRSERTFQREKTVPLH